MVRAFEAARAAGLTRIALTVATAERSDVRRTST